MNYKRHIAGKKANHNGKVFEQIFERACYKHNVTATRFPDGCRQAGQNKLIRVQTPFDYILSQKSRSAKAAFVDTKTINAHSFSNSLIKLHQVNEMLKHEHNGHMAGYVIWTRDNDKVFFIPSSFLITQIGVRGSIDVDSEKAVTLGSSMTFNPNMIWN